MIPAILATTLAARGTFYGNVTYEMPHRDGKCSHQAHPRLGPALILSTMYNYHARRHGFHAASGITYERQVMSGEFICGQYRIVSSMSMIPYLLQTP